MSDIAATEDDVKHTRGHVKGVVNYREGDGIAIEIPRGPIALDITAMDVTISWVEDGVPGSTAIPLPDFRRYVATGALALE